MQQQHLNTVMRGGIPPSPRTPSYSYSMGGPALPSIDTTNTNMEGSPQEQVIVELTRRLAERESQVRSIAQQKSVLESYVQNQAKQTAVYDSLMATYMNANETNQQLVKKLNEYEKVAQELQNNNTMQRLKLDDNEKQLGRLARAEQESKSCRAAASEAQELIKQKDGVMKNLNTERDELIAKLNGSGKNIKEMEAELTGYQVLLEKSKILAEEQINVLVENEKTISGLEATKTDLVKAVKTLTQNLKEKSHALKSRETLLNMQRQEMGEQEALINIYETKFDAKNRNLNQIIARVDWGERIWAKIEVREQKFAAKEIVLGSFREENTSLRADKKRLEAEVDELKACFELYDLKLKGTNDKVHMPWLLSQLRDAVQSKEKVVQLEEIIRCEGYTIKAKEAENEYEEKVKEMVLDIATIKQILRTLKTQTAGEKDVEVPVLLGKLEECLREFGEEWTPPDDITASSDINPSMSMNSFMDDYKNEGVCCGAGDFRDLMHPDHYTVMTSLAAGFPANVGDDEDDLEDDLEDDDNLVEEEADYEGRDNNVDASAYADEEESAEARVDEEEGEGESEEHDDDPTDVHIQKVLKILQKDETDPEDWHTWISPPTSPRNARPTIE